MVEEPTLERRKREQQRHAEGQESTERQRQGRPEGESRRQRKEVERMEAEQWKEYMKQMSRACKENSKMLGLCIRHMLMRAQSDWGGSARKQLFKAATALMCLSDGREDAKKQHKELLPLSLCWSEEDEVWDNKACNPEEVSKLTGAKALEASERAWMQAESLVINTFYEAPQRLSREDSHQ